MRIRRTTGAALRWVIPGLLFATQVQAAELTVLTAGAFKSVATELLPGFEASSGDKVTMRSDTVGGLVRRIQAGETFDVVLMSPGGLDRLAQDGKVAANSEINLARVGVGVAAKTGFPQPDITTVNAFRAAMLHARAVAYIDPASGGSSGIYITKLFQSLGIADAMAARSVLVKGGVAAEAALDGRADLVLQQISELVGVPGVTLIGPLPAQIQTETTYAGAIAAHADAPQAARALLEFLSGPCCWQKA